MKDYITYAVLSAFFASLIPIFGRLGLKNVDSTLATAVRAVIMAVFLVGVALIRGSINVGEIDGRALLLIILSGLAGALSWLFYFMAIKNGRVPAVIAIDKTSVALSIFLSWLVLGDKMDMKTALGALLIVIGAILVSL
ncbi:EamA family transporter [Thermococcus waiotapuensis]|uniref:EamA family transporter n=1 Tax=Thermococcus waiotapuensis TaxID=90909 RepID=A0AAE4NUC2_9EURY|nr:EamA family transporter [Thermococcus waiotapuensis]MDV3102978.1 EamA family transporter [Thermococcus waiotapuensis]